MTTRATIWNEPAPLVLASASVARRALLEAVGIPFLVEPAGLDEGILIARQPRISPGGAAVVLALAKAKAVAATRPGALVLGGDQTLECAGDIFTKPKSLAEARSHLVQLRARAHRLHSAAAVVRGQSVLWQGADSADLTMRAFSDAFLDAYLDHVGDQAMASVGAYQIEGIGLQLFERIEGAHATILGLPLLPLLAGLRELGVLRA